MQSDIRIGDTVILNSVPDWLVHDLPKIEQLEILACVGKEAEVQEIDGYGYYWVGFGITTELEDEARFHGHTFCVPKECLTKREDAPD